MGPRAECHALEVLCRGGGRGLLDRVAGKAGSCRLSPLSPLNLSFVSRHRDTPAHGLYHHWGGWGTRVPAGQPVQRCAQGSMHSGMAGVSPLDPNFCIDWPPRAVGPRHRLYRPRGEASCGPVMQGAQARAEGRARARVQPGACVRACSRECRQGCGAEAVP